MKNCVIYHFLQHKNVSCAFSKNQQKSCFTNIFSHTNKFSHTQTQNINTHRHKFTQNVPPLSMIDFILIGNVKTIIKALVGGYQWQDIQFFIHFFPVAVKTNGL